jgi:hypothetical protein
MVDDCVIFFDDAGMMSIECVGGQELFLLSATIPLLPEIKLQMQGVPILICLQYDARDRS